jgi:hypothetical protein
MAVAMFMEWPGVTQEQYDAVLEELDLDQNPADGGLLHLASLTPDGLRVVDLWETVEAFDAFSQERMMPAVQNAGIESEPRIDIFPVHNMYAPGLDTIAQMGSSSLPEGEETMPEADESISENKEAPAS